MANITPAREAPVDGGALEKKRDRCRSLHRNASQSPSGAVMTLVMDGSSGKRTTWVFISNADGWFVINIDQRSIYTCLVVFSNHT